MGTRLTRRRPARRPMLATGLRAGVSSTAPVSPRSRDQFATFGAIAADSELERDLALALELADAADRMTCHGSARRTSWSRPSPTSRRSPKPTARSSRWSASRLAAPVPRRRAWARSRATTGDGAAPLDRRPDRRHQGLRPRGIPVWATLLALEVDGELALGVVSAPALGTRWWARRGGAARGATASSCGCRRSRGSRTRTRVLVRDRVRGRGHRRRVPRPRAARWRTRGFGDFWSHVLVADGSVDISAEVGGLNLWDVAPLLPIVEEAGGRITDLDGRRARRRRQRGRHQRPAARRSAAPPPLKVRSGRGAR